MVKELASSQNFKASLPITVILIVLLTIFLSGCLACALPRSPAFPPRPKAASFVKTQIPTGVEFFELFAVAYIVVAVYAAASLKFAPSDPSSNRTPLEVSDQTLSPSAAYAMAYLDGNHGPSVLVAPFHLIIATTCRENLAASSQSPQTLPIGPRT